MTYSSAAWIFSICLLLTSVSVNANTTLTGTAVAEQVILEQIRQGEAMFRDDLILEAINRLYRINPDHPEGVFAEIKMAVRHEDISKAEKLLKQLESDSNIYAKADRLIYINKDQGKQQLVKARLFAAAGRNEDAIKVYDEVFESVFPDVNLALEYWIVKVHTKDARQQGIAELLLLVKDNPKHAELLTALAEVLFQEHNAEQAIYYLHELAKLPNQRVKAARREYEYLSTLSVSAETLKKWDQFVQRYSELDIVSQAKDQLNYQKSLVHDDSWQAGQQGLILLNQGDSLAALVLLKQAVARYPESIEFNGGLGLAYLRSGNRPQALKYFELARDNTPGIESTSKWVSLIDATNYWLLLERAKTEYSNSNFKSAKQLYEQAYKLDSSNVFASIGLANTLLAMGQKEYAWSYYIKALNRAGATETDTAVRGIRRYLLSLPPHEALQRINELPSGKKNLFNKIERDLKVALLEKQAEQAEQEGDLELAILLLGQAQSIDLDNTWLSYKLAQLLNNQGRAEEALSAFELHLSRNIGSESAHYANALLLSAQSKWQDASDSLELIDSGLWGERTYALHAKLQEDLLIDNALKLYDAGMVADAIKLMETAKASIRARLYLAGWYLAQKNYVRSLNIYQDILDSEPDSTEAYLGRLEVMVNMGKYKEVKQELTRLDVLTDSNDLIASRRIASIFVAIGEPDKAYSVLANAVGKVDVVDAHTLRDLAQLGSKRNPELSLDTYAKALYLEGELQESDLIPFRNNVAFTRAMRANEQDGWLTGSLRANAQKLYKQQTPVLTVHHDNWLRTDGTKGLSRLNSGVTIAQLEYPVAHGKAFVRADHVIMDAGKLSTNKNGEYTGKFGTCSFAARDVSGSWQSLSGCANNLHQKARGVSAAVGWSDDNIHVDIGTTPQGFKVTNIVGGLTYKSKLGKTGWSLTGSRRPMSNSVLSFAGMKDPRTGIVWGGVVATGATLGLSWDQGGKDGVWASLAYHKITGKNVAGNNRTRLMGGYYRRLVNNADERLTVGLHAMYWRYGKNLSEYTLGHGGYYSPQRYTSIGPSASYARRTANWSFIIEGSASIANSRSDSGSYYPLSSQITRPWHKLSGLGSNISSFNNANSFSGSSSSGFGYWVRGIAERRLSNNLIAGAGFDWQRSKDYSPSRFMLYLRYTFKPWQGSLDMPPSPIEPYANFK